jgi:hypothetical protein
LLEGRSWEDVFPGAGSVELTTDPKAATISLRISKGCILNLVEIEEWLLAW